MIGKTKLPQKFRSTRYLLEKSSVVWSTRARSLFLVPYLRQLRLIRLPCNHQLCLLPGISRQQTMFLSDLRFLVQWFDGSINLWLQHCAVSGLIKRMLSYRACFSLRSNQRFCFVPTVRTVQEVLYRTFFFGLFLLLQVSRLVIASILLSHRLLSRESGLYKVACERHVLYVYLTSDVTLFVRNSSRHVYNDCSMKKQPISTAVVF